MYNLLKGGQCKYPFSDLTILVGQQEGQPAGKNFHSNNSQKLTFGHHSKME